MSKRSLNQNKLTNRVENSNSLDRMTKKINDRMFHEKLVKESVYTKEKTK